MRKRRRRRNDLRNRAKGAKTPEILNFGRSRAGFGALMRFRNGFVGGPGFGAGFERFRAGFGALLRFRSGFVGGLGLLLVSNDFGQVSVCSWFLSWFERS